MDNSSWLKLTFLYPEPSTLTIVSYFGPEKGVDERGLEGGAFENGSLPVLIIPELRPGLGFRVWFHKSNVQTSETFHLKCFVVQRGLGFGVRGSVFGFRGSEFGVGFWIYLSARTMASISAGG